jgi:hypothetical protein
MLLPKNDLRLKRSLENNMNTVSVDIPTACCQGVDRTLPAPLNGYMTQAEWARFAKKLERAVGRPICCATMGTCGFLILFIAGIVVFMGIMLSAAADNTEPFAYVFAVFPMLIITMISCTCCWNLCRARVARRVQRLCEEESGRHTHLSFHYRNGTTGSGDANGTSHRIDILINPVCGADPEEPDLPELLDNALRLKKQYARGVKNSTRMGNVLLEVAKELAKIIRFRIEKAGGIGCRIPGLAHAQQEKLGRIIEFGIEVASQLMDSINASGNNDVFVSFPGEARFLYVPSLVEKLRSSNLRVFVDEKMGPQGAADTHKTMLDNALTATVIVCICSCDAVQKKWPLAELLCGLARNGRAAEIGRRTPLIVDAFPGNRWLEEVSRLPREWVDDLRTLVPMEPVPAFQACQSNNGKHCRCSLFCFSSCIHDPHDVCIPPLSLQVENISERLLA